MMVKVSFIVPAYNVESYIGECIESIINQTEKDTQIIIVDDGSTDKTPAICDDFAKKDDRIVVAHKENGGLSSARLAGFQKATGKYILFVDGDDYIEPLMAEKLIESAEENNSDVVLCGYFTNSNDYEEKYYLSLVKNLITGREEIIEKYIQPFVGRKQNAINLPRFLCFKLLKKELIKPDYFKHENIYFSEDVVFNLLYTDNVNVISVVNEPLYHYRNNPKSLSNKYRPNKWQMYLNLIVFLEDYLNERNIEIDNERLSDTVISAVFSSIDNAVISGSYKTYLKEVKQIGNDNLVKKRLPKNIQSQSFSIKLSLTLLKYKQLLLLYIIRKIRLKMASRI